MRFNFTSFTFYIILLFSLPSSNYSRFCPAKCSCFRTTINCNSRGLNTVPHLNSIRPKIIDLSGNNIHEITQDLMDISMDSVEELYLNHSQINNIPANAFVYLKRLEELHLAFNLLNDIPFDIIHTNSRLTLLDLSYNYLREMPLIHSQSLEVFGLVKCGIKQISNESLSFLPNLRLLMLQENALKTVDASIFVDVNPYFTVNLNYNLFDCDCVTISLWNYLEKNDILYEALSCMLRNGSFVSVYNFHQANPNCTEMLPKEGIVHSTTAAPQNYSLIESSVLDGFVPIIGVMCFALGIIFGWQLRSIHGIQRYDQVKTIEMGQYV